MIFPAPPRRLRAELLDLDEAPFEEVKESLRDVRQVNRYLSGYRVLLHHAEKFLREHKEPRPFRVLDIATGSADQPVALVKLARRLGIPVHVTAVDINAKMLKFAREEATPYPEIHFIQCDALALPFRTGSFDLVTNSLSLHHFTTEDAVAILKAGFFVCRGGLIINDLHRSRVAWGAIWVLARLLTRNRLTRYDAPVSVMNAFTPAELGELARKAGLTGVEVHRHFPYRIALIARKWPVGEEPSESVGEA